MAAISSSREAAVCAGVQKAVFQPFVHADDLAKRSGIHRAQAVEKSLRERVFGMEFAAPLGREQLFRKGNGSTCGLNVAHCERGAHAGLRWQAGKANCRDSRIPRGEWARRICRRAGLEDIPAQARYWEEQSARLSRKDRLRTLPPAHGRGDRAVRGQALLSARTETRGIRSSAHRGAAKRISSDCASQPKERCVTTPKARSSATPPEAKSGAGAQAKRQGSSRTRSAPPRSAMRARSHLSWRANAPRCVSAPLIRQSMKSAPLFSRRVPDGVRDRYGRGYIHR